MNQLSLFDSLRAPAIRRPVDPNGPVIQCNPTETVSLESKRFAWPHAKIELHVHIDGTWMWSASFQCGDHGNSYRVGPKWGKFAESRDDALYYACVELRSRIAKESHSDAKLIRAWIEQVMPVNA